MLPSALHGYLSFTEIKIQKKALQKAVSIDVESNSKQIM
jgi:hypothetical protein